MAFLEDITPFYGTIEKNEFGQTLEAFLEEYDPKKYENPCSTTDVIVIRSNGEIKQVNTGLCVLLIKRRNHPGIGRYALPGGFVEIREDLIDAAKRELTEETGLTNIAVEQMYTWGEVFRDPRTRIITTSYLAIVDDTVDEVKAGDDACDAQWFDLEFQKTSSEILTSDENRRQRRKDIYQLILSSQEESLHFDATICVSYYAYGILKEVDYQVLDNSGLAFDHPRMIVQALLSIEKRIREDN
ncbi:MAG: 8-oxo-dGTP diphosphatase [Clostridiales bacterium]|nr:8-oxo-dGTP diphosphatase [Clostridiales bacterium]